MGIRRWAAGAVAVALAVVGAGQAQAVPEGVVHAAGAQVVEGRYIVALKPRPGVAAQAAAEDIAGRYGVQVERVYRRALTGFVVSADPKDARRLAADPRVARVEADAVVYGTGTRVNPVWNLDRIDQRTSILDGAYHYPDEAGAGVTAYVFDTGIRTSHAEFGGRASVGFDAIGDGWNGQDCNTEGHGTHVAGTIGGAEHGLAARVDLVSVRVLSCENLGTVSQIIAGVDWVTQNAIKPAVANMSLGGGASELEDAAVANSIASGVTYVVAAGNWERDACEYSPARVPGAITVAASNSSGERARGWGGEQSGSNHGSCVDIFAPGQEIKSAHNGSDTATRILRGTSMASPHVAGAAALVLSRFPDATPAEVTDILLARATVDALDPAALGAGSPNRLLYTGGSFEPPDRDFGVAVGSTAVTVEVGSSTTVPITTTNLVDKPQTLAVTASGAPAGASLSVSPASVPAGQGATLTIAVTGDAPSFTATVTATGPYGLVRTATVDVTVPPRVVCTLENTTRTPIPDMETVTSTLTVTSCPRQVSSAPTVRVRVEHTYRGDLSVRLVSPDGVEHTLKAADGADGAANLDQTFPLTLAPQQANGEWRLVVRDNFGFDVGTLVGWTLAL
ncbi:S8 family serine peptidase [Actinokineospora sp. UTMC 2448]|uniref:S8 family serine peptidase n=1 Tax=Actinokineospora sp. UTMC 2448 TaxID=2268449 RepID=UPI002164C221|nr:S8 family serine peptidase [Actinokineospora sp. UTMC 2448]UVS79158.1 Extracellular serine proteinase precursor [Actinokineospora sp. UTMC 2448]